MFSSDGKKPKHNNNKPERVARLLQILLPERHEMHNNPNQPHHRHKQIEPIPPTLPIPENAQRARLHTRLEQKQKRKNSRHRRQRFRNPVIRPPRPRQQATIQQHQKRREPFKRFMLRNIKNPSSNLTIFGPRRNMKWLS